MFRRLSPLLMVVVILALLVGACGEFLPKPIATCQSHSDCAAQRVCIQQVCVSRGVADLNKDETHSKEVGLEPTNSTETNPQEKDDPKESQNQESTDNESNTEIASDSDESTTDGGEAISEKPPTECQPGSSVRCYPFKPGTQGIGLCKEGTKLCTAKGVWGPCIGAIGPQAESCDGDTPSDEDCDGILNEGCNCLYNNSPNGVCPNGVVDDKGVCQPPKTYNVKDICNDNLDNNCDGTIDDGCQCTPNESRKCGKNIGVCTQGMQTCQNGLWGPCTGGIQPSAQEKCRDSLDNNCNGVVDEGCPCNFNSSSKGVCATAKRDSQGKCMQPLAYKSTEDCSDAFDNNCDGVVNEGCPCDYQGKSDGVCKGSQLDRNGNCTHPPAYGTSENCNDTLDNNCDGAINEGCSCNFNNKPQGECAKAKRDGKGSCVPPATYRAQEICGDNLDNNCDGAIDEACPCNFKGIAKGVCASAKRDAKGVCQQPTTYSAKENCADNLDNDCDGNVNEGCACKPGQTESCGIDVGICKKGIRTCQTSGQWGPCQGSISPQSKEICSNNADENCNGVVEEFCPCNFNGNTKGVCGTTTRDARGKCQVPTNYNARDVCGDNLDNNCNGYIDENCPCLFRNTNAGVCKLARTNAQGVCQQPAAYQTSEKCGDNLDNNCNGVVDEYCSCNYANRAFGVCGTAKRDAKGVCQRPYNYSTTDSCADNFDNDCDGVVNEFCACVYQNKHNGVCKQARRDSKGTCQPPSSYSTTDQCGDKLDNNCNSHVDENCPCNYLGKTKGVCATAKSSSTGYCQRPSTYSTYETCDNLDNNCNGVVDENVLNLSGVCKVPGKKGECAVGLTSCVNGQIKCVAQQPNPAPEVCDGKDNNCDGRIDNLANTNCYQVRGKFCYKGTAYCQSGRKICNINNATVLRCTAVGRCNQLCPTGRSYQCVKLGGANSDKGCALQ